MVSSTYGIASSRIGVSYFPVDGGKPDPGMKAKYMFWISPDPISASSRLPTRSSSVGSGPQPPREFDSLPATVKTPAGLPSRIGLLPRAAEDG